MNIPSEITAGDSVSWEDSPTTDNLGNSIASPIWTLKYDFRQSGVANLSVTAVASGSGWRTSLTTGQTTLYAAGKLYYQAYAVNGSARVTLGQGYITLFKNLADSASNGAGEFRSQAQQDLDAVQAAMRAIIAGGAVAEYTIGTRSLRKLNMEDLIKLESKLRADVVREQQAQMIKDGKGNPNNLFVRFS